jgi:hypothetical protein
MINMIWRARVPTSRLPLRGRMVSGFIAERWGGKRLLARRRMRRPLARLGV